MEPGLLDADRADLEGHPRSQQRPVPTGRPDQRRRFWGICVLLGWVSSSGCAVLTKSQVQEVKAFAHAAESYGTLPGEPIRVYAAVDRMDRILIVSARHYSEADARGKAWTELQQANRASAAFTALAKRADLALDVLETYSRLLVKLTSDQFTESLETNARDLGQSLDRAIDRYNDSVGASSSGTRLGLIGGTVAAMVRGTGGVWIRHRQARCLKACVGTAQPVIEELSVEVQRFMTNRVLADFDVLESRFKTDFETAAGRMTTLPSATLVSVADAQEDIGRARRLCRSAAAAAVKLSAAHAKLAQALATRQTLKSHLAEIEALAEEIKRAKQLKGSGG